MQRFAPTLVFLLVACHSGGGQGGANVPGDTASHAPYQGIAAGETLRFTGTEPFWGGQVTGGTLTYTTPESQTGWTIPVERFGGRGGLGFSGTLKGETFMLAVTPGECSDGMSDRTYPFTVTLRTGGQASGEVRNGCGWADARPFTRPPAP